MNYKLELHELAEEELWAAVDYYDEQKNRLGKDFAKALQITMQTLRKNPALFPKVYKNRRKAVIKKFPYMIVYEVSKDTIFVLSIFHTHRNPKIWKKRS